MIAIVDAYDNPNAEADLAVYRVQCGLPSYTTANGYFKNVDQCGGTDYPQPSETWAGEVALDRDMVSAAAPSAHILFVETDNASLDNLAAGVERAVALGAKYVSTRTAGWATVPATWPPSAPPTTIPVSRWWRPGDNRYGGVPSRRRCRS
ncbi:hypothetical protein ABZV15_37295 [Streptomyces sp. NPDC005246]|uniref:hypothetical protein n=1 Tax=Streptomyces sp. NPDC005246 TaxID=3156716 RepID=UPI0033B91219